MNEEPSNALYNVCQEILRLEAINKELVEQNTALRQAIEVKEKKECETCAAKRKRLMEAGFLNSPLRGEDHVS